MSGAVGRAALLVVFPVAAAITGALIATVRPPGPKVTSGVQHFAAGVVFAAVAGEVLPDIRHKSLTAVLIGFAAGVVVLLVLRRYSERAEASSPDRQTLPFGLLAAIAIDLLIDGLLVGIGATVGAKQGRVLTVALTLEILFLALSVSGSLTERSLPRWQTAVIPSALLLAVVIGAIGGALALSGANAPLLAGVLAFGAAALLYLVVEELLTEAHELPIPHCSLHSSLWASSHSSPSRAHSAGNTRRNSDCRFHPPGQTTMRGRSRRLAADVSDELGACHPPARELCSLR